MKLPEGKVAQGRKIFVPRADLQGELLLPLLELLLGLQLSVVSCQE